MVDVPPKLSARVRVFATGQGRKTDPTDRPGRRAQRGRGGVTRQGFAAGCRRRRNGGAAAARRGLLVDRPDELGRARTDLVNRIHKLLLELLPGGAKTFLSADQARALLNTIRPRDLVGRTRRRLACELIGALVQIDKKIKAAKKELTDLVKASGSSLQDLNGITSTASARPAPPA